MSDVWRNAVKTAVVWQRTSGWSKSIQSQGQSQLCSQAASLELYSTDWHRWKQTHNVPCFRPQNISYLLPSFSSYALAVMLNLKEVSWRNTLPECNACIVLQTAKTGVSGIWPMSIPGFRWNWCQPIQESVRLRLKLQPINLMQKLIAPEVWSSPDFLVQSDSWGILGTQRDPRTPALLIKISDSVHQGHQPSKGGT